jgi:hypothetical protein
MAFKPGGSYSQPPITLPLTKLYLRQVHPVCNVGFVSVWHLLHSAAPTCLSIPILSSALLCKPAPLPGSLTMAETWADQPFKLIPTMVMRDVKVNPTVYHIANEMVLAHNAMIRSLNAMYLQAPYLKSEADSGDLLLYAKFW